MMPVHAGGQMVADGEIGDDEVGSNVPECGSYVSSQGDLQHVSAHAFPPLASHCRTLAHAAVHASLYSCACTAVCSGSASLNGVCA